MYLHRLRLKENKAQKHGVHPHSVNQAWSSGNTVGSSFDSSLGHVSKVFYFFSSLRSCIVPWINMNLHRLSLNQKRRRSHPQLIAWNWERARSNRAWTIVVDRAVLFIFPVCSFFTVFDQGELVKTQGPEAHWMHPHSINGHLNIKWALVRLEPGPCYRCTAFVSFCQKTQPYMQVGVDWNQGPEAHGVHLH
jgi:hypothetical protein